MQEKIVNRQFQNDLFKLMLEGGVEEKVKQFFSSFLGIWVYDVIIIDMLGKEIMLENVY